MADCIIVTAGVIVVVLFLVLFEFDGLGIIVDMTTPSPPTCSLREFDFSALNASALNNISAGSIYYDLTLKNINSVIGVRYDALNVTFYYEPDPVDDSIPMIGLGGAVIPAFYQGFGKGTHRVGNVSVADARNVSAMAKADVVAGGTAAFRVTMTTAVRYRFTYGTKKQRDVLEVGAKFKVDGQGLLVKHKHKKGFELTDPVSRAGKLECGCSKYYALGLVLLVQFVVTKLYFM